MVVWRNKIAPHFTSGGGMQGARNTPQKSREPLHQPN
ncbi:hypothetical protein predicted by Glimmer/Critica [Salmonella enterica subsp. enterica serovar Weltevreden str. 2007-60-3289-1]|nr:hypothetical protein predicted by Glimmer/Critica [Salmonella enterica subsp. enterica serovar Weltevreden str. 2007-60-3289-1]